jgi:stage V sporulation protein SpoVS
MDVRVTFPWVDFPRAVPSAVGEETFDELRWASSAPALMPALVVLAVPGVGWLVGAVRRRQRAALLVAIGAGACVGAAGALAIGHVANRYLGDLVPAVVLPAFVGAHALFERAPAWRRRRRRAISAALALLVVAGAWTSVGLGLVYQRERGPSVPEEWRAELFAWRAGLPGGNPPVIRVTASASRPWLPVAADGTVAVAGDCLGMYVRVGERWYGVSRGPGVGVWDLRVDLDALGDDLLPWERVPVIVFGEGEDAGIVALARLRDGRVRVDIDSARSGGWLLGYPTELHGEVTMRISIDPRSRDRYVSVGETVLHDQGIVRLGARATIGALPQGTTRGGLAERYPSDIQRLQFDKSLCRAITGQN